MNTKQAVKTVLTMLDKEISKATSCGKPVYAAELGEVYDEIVKLTPITSESFND